MKIYKTAILSVVLYGCDSGGSGEYVYPNWRKQTDAAENNNEKLQNL
jgi:hypothetical protein